MGVRGGRAREGAPWRTPGEAEESIRICAERDILRDYPESRREYIMEYVWDMTDAQIPEVHRRAAERRLRAEIAKEVANAITKENARAIAARCLSAGS